MKVLLSWLREFAPIEKSPTELADTLSDLGLTVEELRPVGEGLGGIVVARVLGLRPHPNADKIQLVDVDAGDGEALQIACGAFNMAVGDLVPLASLGTHLADGRTIERRKLRGQWSNGMLCSARELALGHDDRGIWILPIDAAPGQPLTDALGLTADVLYDLEVNPNRPDAMSMAGVARDLAARLGLPFRLPEPRVVETTGGPAASELVNVEVVDPVGCGRFTAKVLRNVSLGQSPPQMATRLTLCGMRPINALVDISNYVMLELGQPNHPYDLDLVPGRGLRVRRAGDGERLVTLDDVERTFTPDDLLICDGDDGPVGIAGVMGGASCEISDTTTDVLLENAWFDPLSVAKTARRLGLRTEASARFEKGCDPEGIERAVARFCELAQRHCGAEVVSGLVDVTGELPERRPVRLRTERLNALLGTELSVDEIRSWLDPIGFTTAPAGGGSTDLDVEIPSWRHDSAVEIDVIEEVARLHGYPNIARTVPPAVRFGHLEARQHERRRVRRVLAGLGLAEAMPMPFLAPGDLERAGLPGDGIGLTNPLVADESVLRTSLLPGLLKVLAHNAHHRNLGVGLWEIGHVFRPRPPGGPGGDVLPDERELVAMALGGREAPAAVEVWCVLADALAVADHRVDNAEAPGLHPGRSARVAVAGETIGVVDAYEIPERVAWLEIDLGRLVDLPHGERRYRLVSKFPSADIDLAFEVDDPVPATDVAAAIASAGGDLLQSVNLFDVFRGPPVGDGRRSLAYRLRFQAPDRTLTDAEVGEVRQRIIEGVESALPANLRG